MRQESPISASLGAIISSLAMLGCCLPLGFVAFGAAGASVFGFMRPWLLGLSVVLLGVGFWQRHRATYCSTRRRYVGTALLWVATVIVVGMILFPQEITGLIADVWSGGWK